MNIYDVVVNRRDDTMDDLLDAISQDYAKYNGFALHVNYNALGKIVAVAHIPFEMCRLGMANEIGKVDKIAIFNDWTGTKTINGKRQTPKKDTIDYIDVFDPRPDVVFQQMQVAGGIAAYKGQVMYCSANGNLVYPLPTYDSAIPELSTDEGLSNIRYRNVRNSFLISGVLVTKEGNTVENENAAGEMEDEFDCALRAVQGDVKACSLLHMTIGRDDDMPQLINFEPTNYDDKFKITDECTIANIYAAFEQEPFYRMRTGSVGFSTDMITDAYEYYASLVASDQRFIERAFSRLFKYYHINLGDDFRILPAKFMRNGNHSNS